MPYLKRNAPQPEPIDCRILTAALDLIVDNGYHNVSVHQIQKRADVSIGSIYNHFGGKEGIAKALYQHIANELDELVEDAINENSQALEQYKEIVKQLFNYSETHSNIIAFAFHAKHTEFIQDEPLMNDSPAFIKIKEIIENGATEKKLKQAQSTLIAPIIFGGIIHIIQLRLDGAITNPLPELYNDAIDINLKGLIAI